MAKELTANEKELVEKYARTITVNSPDIIKEFDAGVEVSEVATDILTRFASEITVDAEKVWCELLAIYVKLNGPFEDRDDYEDIITVSKPDLIAAIKSAGGGK